MKLFRAPNFAIQVYFLPLVFSLNNSGCVEVKEAEGQY